MSVKRKEGTTVQIFTQITVPVFIAAQAVPGIATEWTETYTLSVSTVLKTVRKSKE